MVEGITPDETLDCRGLSCPMPFLKTKKAIKKNLFKDFATQARNAEMIESCDRYVIF
jgi:hypothetical protein